MDISVIICTYNRASGLLQTLQSIRQMDIPEGTCWELIIVDNNSSDDTQNVIQEFARSADIDIKNIFEGTQGLSYARNAGLERATGKLIAFTDDDVIVDRQWLANISRAFASSDAWCIGGKILPIWSRPKPKWLSKRIHYALALLDYGDEVKEMTSPSLWGANMSFRAAVFDSYGRFDTSLGRKGGNLVSGEETELMKKILGDEKRVLYVPDIVVKHVIDVSRINKRYFIKWHFTQGQIDGSNIITSQGRKFIPLFPLINIGTFVKRMIVGMLGQDPDVYYYKLEIYKSVGLLWGSARALWAMRVGK